MQKFSYLKSTNAAYIDELFERYLKDANSVDESWRWFFEGIELGADIPLENGNGHIEGATATPVQAGHGVDLSAEAKVAELIQAYREIGLAVSNIDPLNPPPSSHPLLDLAHFGLGTADLQRTFSAGKLIGIGPATLEKIIQHLRETYSSSIGVEFTHIQNPEARIWLQQQMESTRNRAKLDLETRKLILKRLAESESFERFLHTRYVGQKRFSVEGGESVIPFLDCMIETGAELGAKEFVLGMAHRGRLNVLTNIFGKKTEMMFTEFEGTYKFDISEGEGDVKYHKGYSSDMTTRTGKAVHLSLASNPSHLEFVNPVVEGVCRAKQQLREDRDRTGVVPVLIHGDAAFAGQGIVYETLNLSQLEGYRTGGTVNIVINNQVGFTTSPRDSRSTTYCTDVAKMLECPIFHVNGDDPEAVWFVAKLSTEYRQKFHVDVVIDLICYRKHGHNEGDEPAFTQPLMYRKIKAHGSTREQYAKKLVAEGAMTEAEAEAVVEKIMSDFTEAQTRVKAKPVEPLTSVFQNAWKGLRAPTEDELFAPVSTAVDSSKLLTIAERINKIPEGFHLHSKLARFFDARLKAVKDGKGIDWGNGEALAFASLLAEGYPVRVSGQDAERGTFTHRHAVLTDVETGERYTPFDKVDPKQAKLQIHNSHLSESGVMGFEYGYSLADPRTLVIWEAQFGDFANGAQVIIDQFLATSESKWRRFTGLTLLLPHGYEGQGPEHSSARLERFLQLCGRNNMFVCNITTPANLFHALRRQVKREFRRPMVIMSPKSLLRHPNAISDLSDFTSGAFTEVYDETDSANCPDPKKVKRVLLASGKVYYDLASERVAKKRTDVAILRLEQLYPWPAKRLVEVLGKYSGAKDIVWVQEEPRNMGGWTHVFGMWMGGFDDFASKVGGRGIRYVGRDLAASPAVGSPKAHEKEQRALVEKAFAD